MSEPGRSGLVMSLGTVVNLKASEVPTYLHKLNWSQYCCACGFFEIKSFVGVHVAFILQYQYANMTVLWNFT